MSVMGRVRFRRDAEGRAIVEAPQEAAVLAEFLETDVGEEHDYFLEKLDQAEAGDDVGISLNACYFEADRTGIRIEHLHREGEGMRCALTLGEVRSLLTAWAAFIRTP
ncbi:MAG TPA: hypothetical protein VED18_01140 [Candidatus Sulfotelmatobacter sp.]|nr:hypothetical protein [Candidatus Sulfotelmatobacter sp.]